MIALVSALIISPMGFSAAWLSYIKVFPDRCFLPHSYYFVHYAEYFSDAMLGHFIP